MRFVIGRGSLAVLWMPKLLTFVCIKVGVDHLTPPKVGCRKSPSGEKAVHWRQYRAAGSALGRTQKLYNMYPDSSYQELTEHPQPQARTHSEISFALFAGLVSREDRSSASRSFNPESTSAGYRAVEIDVARRGHQSLALALAQQHATA